MKEKLRKTLSDQWIFIVIAIDLGIGVITGFLNSNFYLHFLNGITVSGMLTLFIGIAKWFWKEGDFAYFVWRQKKDGPYTAYRHDLIDKRKDKTNPCLYGGAAVTILATILSFLY
ncbi:MAG: hypothetical protein EOM64_05705 [Erysipelotrichia bacterium]|nr:hypothetical protein [Erysipelotrichia bacterium]